MSTRLIGTTSWRHNKMIEICDRKDSLGPLEGLQVGINSTYKTKEKEQIRGPKEQIRGRLCMQNQLQAARSF